MHTEAAIRRRHLCSTSSTTQPTKLNKIAAGLGCVVHSSIVRHCLDVMLHCPHILFAATTCITSNIALRVRTAASYCVKNLVECAHQKP